MEKVMRVEKLTPITLKNQLWENLLDLKSGKTPTSQGNAVTKAGAAITNVTKQEIDVAKWAHKIGAKVFSKNSKKQLGRYFK